MRHAWFDFGRGGSGRVRERGCVCGGGFTVQDAMCFRSRMCIR